VNNKILSSSALVALLSGFSLLAACSGDDEEPNPGSGGKGASGGTGGVGGSIAGKGGSAGAAVGGVGGVGGAAGGPPLGGMAGAAASAGSPAGAAGVPGGAAGSMGLAGAAGMAGAGGAAGDAGMAGAAGIGAGMGGVGGEIIGAMAAYHFDMPTTTAGAAGAAFDGTEGWQINSGACNANAGATSVAVTQSADQFKAGTGSLKISFTGISMAGAGGAAGAAGSGAGTAGTGAGMAGMGGAAAGAAGAAGAGGAAPMNVDCHVKKTAAPLETGKTVTYHIWIPPDVAGGAVGWVKLIIEAGATYSWVSPPDVGGMPDIPLTTRSAWVMKSFTVPLSTVPPLQSIGFQFGVQNTFTGSFYIDEVIW